MSDNQNEDKEVKETEDEPATPAPASVATDADGETAAGATATSGETDAPTEKTEGADTEKTEGADDEKTEKTDAEKTEGGEESEGKPAGEGETGEGAADVKEGEVKEGEVTEGETTEGETTTVEETGGEGEGETVPIVSEDAETTEETVEENKIVASEAWEAEPDADDLEVVTEVDSDEGGQRIYANSYVTSLGPLRTYCFLLGRFPFTYLKTSSGLFEFFFVNTSLFGMFFILTSIFHFLLLFIVSINLFGLLLNVPRQDGSGVVNGTGKWTLRAEELFIFHRNAAPFIVFMGSLIHVCVGNAHILAKREFIANYFTFWTEALQTMKLHAADGVFSSMFSILFVEALFLAAYGGLSWARFAPVTSGAPGLLVLLMFRIVFPQVHESPYYQYLRWGATIIFFYVLACGKIYVFLFLFKSKLIGNAFGLWNHRLDTVLNRSDDYIVRGNRLGKRTGFRELFQDHVVLLDLLEGADVLFSETMESFFTCEVGSFCFLLYFVIQALVNSDDFQEARKLDVVVGGLLLLNSIIVISLLASAISSVSQETMDGLEILRRKGFFGRKSPEELYFLLSLYTSYNGHFETSISGAGYYVMNKEFLLTIAGSFLAYMVILLQFSPSLNLVDPALVSQIPSVTELIKRVEDTQLNIEAYKPGYLLMSDYLQMYDFDDHIEESSAWPPFM